VDLVYADLIVGSIVGSIVSSSISALRTEVSLVLFLSSSVVDDRSVVAGAMTYTPLIGFPATVQEDGEVVEYSVF